MDIHEGDIFWAAPSDSPGIRHPYVVIDASGGGPIVTICALTTNRKRGSLPGNVLLEAGEANLPRQSVVEVSKLSRIDTSQLNEFIGSLAEPRVHQILAGIRFIERLRRPDAHE
jgi:mRNA interferase MazF